MTTTTTTIVVDQVGASRRRRRRRRCNGTRVGRRGFARISARARTASAHWRALANLQSASRSLRNTNKTDLSPANWPGLLLAVAVIFATATALSDQSVKLPVRAAAGSKVRVSRQLASDGQQQQQQHANVPYKTVDVTRACEWKSNLFVPKSNDVHFASALATAPDVAQHADDSRLLFTTDSRALVLALPLDFGPGFAGFEQACSIRLIVPSNMRILAKISARRLSFAADDQQQQQQQQQVLQLNPQPFQQPASVYGQLQQVHSEHQRAATWLNVSQNGLVENELKTLETAANVLAFRFLFERFANKLQPDIRLQVVLTAFQTLAENSELNSNRFGQFGLPTGGKSSAEQQFICDQQRLISANLACDGYKNCQDASDEDPAICRALRDQPAGNQQTATTTTTVAPVAPVAPGNATAAGSSLADWDPDTVAALAGLLVGLVAACMLVLCFVYFVYLCLIVWHRRWLGLELDSSGATTTSSPLKLSASTSGDATSLASAGQRRLNRRQRLALALASSEPRRNRRRHLSEAARQNAENERRLRQTPAQLSLGPPPPQSILKRPQQQPQPQRRPRPVEPPPAAPGRRVGALASQLNDQQQPKQQQQVPTPAQRLTRPTRPAPRPQARLTSYHYSGGSTQYSAAYLERLARDQQHQRQHQHQNQPQTSAASGQDDKLASLI